MKKTAIAALALLALAGAATADVRETQTFAGPYQSYGDDINFDDSNPLNQTISVTFTGAGYTPNGLYMQLDMTSLAAGTYASEVVFTVTPPSGPAFYITPAYTTNVYTSLTDVTLDIALPASVGAVGTWSFKLWDSYPDGGNAAPQSQVTNVRISLQDLTLPTPPASTDLGTLGSADITSTIPDYVGGQTRWWKFTAPADANIGNGYYVDLDTVGSNTQPNVGSTLVNDTELAVYDANGFFYGTNDDGTDGYESVLTFGSDAPRSHGASTGIYDGYDGDLYAGTYYVAGGTYNTAFGDSFNVTSTSTSPGGTLVLNIFSNFPSGPAACSPADLGAQGGLPGQDNLLNNNDFIVFIDYFFNQNALADFGIQGGVAGHDGAFDNNDFIAFIDAFFNDQALCNG